MNEGVEVSVGQVLREAREAQNITLEDVAMRLRLMHRQVDAMETDDFGSLGQPVFARGFVRNYARLMGLQPEPLLARMDGAPAEPSPVAPPEHPMPASWLTSPWLILFLLGVLVVVAVPISLYWWLNSDAGEPQHAVIPVKQEPHPAPAVTSVVPSIADAPAEAPVSPIESVVGTDASVEADVPPVAATPASRSQLHLEFGEESWVEIKDASGRTLHRQLNPAGSSVDIQGQPPFDVLIGNAAQARMTYNGRPIDLKPFISVTVARFTLEE
ncbi:MAG: helix-turn-helix domain-containing protein [Sulfuriferula multivorans]|uniref:Helix-turn-helix domain-containing protein n=1 Tax=Sulfuriferula multivorans TaxID=1559896 RepID=A0A7C9K9N4_9PROT|nr:helix-turn-helix domain-containing protein [Sulfuriferula multivorans]